MLRTHMTACLLATMFVAAPALAQTATTTPATPTLETAPVQPRVENEARPEMRPGGAAVGGPVMAQQPTAGVDYIAERHPGSYRASDLMGKDVYGANNEDIGEINDVIIGRDGQVMAVVVGVGGFLGIGEKDVAVPMQSLQFQADARNDVTETGAIGNNAATNPTGGSVAATRATRSDPLPDRIMLGATKEQLENAPSFRDEMRADAGAMNRPAAPNTTAPRQ
jgi:sporulation protein YlmC with PRC-barrel domain